MNQQFMQQQSYGPSASGIPQNYPPTSKMAPVPTGPALLSQTASGFQTVPLGPLPAAQLGVIEPQQMMNKLLPPASIRPPANQLPPGAGVAHANNQSNVNYQQNGAARQHEQHSPERNANELDGGGYDAKMSGGGMRAVNSPRQQSQSLQPPPPPISGQPPLQSENGPAPTPQSIFATPQQSIPDAAPPQMFPQPPQQRRPPVPGQQHQQTTQMSAGHQLPTGQPQMSAGQPQISTGQHQMSAGQYKMSAGHQMSAGQPPMSAGQPQMSTRQPQITPGQPHMSAGHQMSTGQPPRLTGQPPMSTGHAQITTGQPPMSTGHQMSTGQPPMSTGQVTMSAGPPQILTGPPQISAGHQMLTGPPQMSAGQQMLTGQPPMLAGQPTMSAGPPQKATGQPPMSTGQPPMATALPQMSAGQQMSTGQSSMSTGPPQMSAGHQMSTGQPPMSTGQPAMATGLPQMSTGQPPMSTGPPQMSAGHQMSTGQPPMSAGHGQMLAGPHRSSQMPHGLHSGPSGGVPMSAGHQFGAVQLSGQQMSSAGQAPLQTQQQQSVPRPGGMPAPVLGSVGGGVPPPSVSSVGGPPRGATMPPSMKQSSGQGMAGPPMQQSNFAQPPPPLDPMSAPMQNIHLGGPTPHQYHAPQPSNMNGTPMTVSGPTIGGLPHMPPPPPQNYHMNGGQQQYAPPLGGSQGRAPAPVAGYQPQQAPGGYGGVPHAQGGYGGVAHAQQGVGYLQQQQKRLDPDQMPSQIQVTEDDQSLRSGKFYANQKGLVPPLVTTAFTVLDQGYASPRFIRSTMYNVPVSNDLMKQTSVPFALVISPMARTMQGEYTPPCVDFGALGPVRCIRCKAYMGPYMQFIDSGRRFVCVFCRASTEVPTEYFQHLDHTGLRMDRMERPELVLGTYELTATVDYCRNNAFPKSPAFIFIVDVSYNSIKSGLVHLICAEMKQILKNLPIDQGEERSKMRVGFITYDRDVHFYNIKGNLAAPQMLVVGDTHEMFMPLLDGFLCTPEESEAVIDSLMEQIPCMFGETKECETILLPAITAGLEALKASECVGKLLVFHSTLPTAEAPGKLKNRDERKLLGTDKERTVLTPQSTVYNQLGQDCVGAGCSVDMYLFNNAYIDIATVGQVARLTGGEVFKYTYFQADLDGTRLLNDIITNVSRPIAFDAIMRVRTSTGVRPTDFYGHFFMSNTTDIELAAVDCDKAIAVEIKHDDKLSEEDGVYIQVALLYTSCAGIRRLRIINQAMKTCSQMSDLYRSCDLDTIVNFFGKQSVWKLMENNPKIVKDTIVNRAAQMLANYRKNCANPSSAGQLILPECMKLLPLYVNCLLKSDAISGGADMTLDDRSFVMQAVMTMDVPTSVNYFYPRLLPLHEMKVSENGEMSVPGSIRCSIAKFTDQGVYILENGIHMFMWIGLAAYQDFIQQVFGVASAAQVNTETSELPLLDNAYSKAVHSLIDNIRRQRHRYMRLTLVRQREKLEPVFRHFLVEDQGHDNSASYVDFLCHMHKEIRTMLS